MAKDKKKTDLSTEAAIKKHFGKVISTGSELRVKKKDYKTLSVSPNLDLALNGGLLEGTWTIISGNPKGGKSTTALQICKNAQDEGRNVIYLDAESRLKDYNLVGVQGLNLDEFQVVHGEDEGDALAAEDFLKIAESMFKMPKNKGAVCVIDSCSSLVPRAELEEDPSATLRASLPKLLSHWVKKNAHSVTQNKIIVIIITHYITNTSGYGKIKIPDCGVMVQYQADTRLDISKIENWEEDGKKVGQKVIWNIGCSSLGASGTEAQSYLRYGIGIDKVQEMIELAELFGIIEKGGSWYKVDFLENQFEFTEPPKYQGQAKLYNFISSRDDVYKLMLEKIKEIFV